VNKAVSLSLMVSVGILTVLLFAGANVPAAPADPVPCPTTRTSNLDVRLTDVQFPSIPLENVIDQLRELTHANIVVDWRVLEAEGIERSARVRVHLWDVKLGQVLRIVLDDLSDDLSYQEQDGIITVSTRERLAVNGVMRIYDVRPLIETLFLMNPGQPPTRYEAADAIVQVIESIIDPESWKDNGGDKSIREVLGMLVVVQTPANQRKVETLLREIQTGQGPHMVQLKRLATNSAR